VAARGFEEKSAGSLYSKRIVTIVVSSSGIIENRKILSFEKKGGIEPDSGVKMDY
jgi:hypothetical protein